MNTASRIKSPCQNEWITTFIYANIDNNHHKLQSTVSTKISVACDVAKAAMKDNKRRMLSPKQLLGKVLWLYSVQRCR